MVSSTCVNCLESETREGDKKVIFLQPVYKGDENSVSSCF